MNTTEMLANFTSVLNATMSNTTEAMPPARKVGSSARSDLAFIYQCVLAPVGIITNILNLMCLRKFRRGALNVYLTTLSAIDLIFSLNLVVSTYYRTLKWTESYWFAEIYAKTVIPINSIFGHLSIWLAVIIAADRMVHVAFPMEARVWVTRFRAKIVVAVALTLLIIIRSPIFFYFYAASGIVPPGPEAGEDVGKLVYWATFSPFFFTPLGRGWFSFQAAVFEFIPGSILVVLNIIIIFFFRRYLQKRAKLMEGKNKDLKEEVQQEFKLTITLSFVMLSALIGNFPVNLTRLIFPAPSDGVIFKDIASFLFILDHTTNFLIYFVSNPDFRGILLGFCSNCVKDDDAALPATIEPVNPVAVTTTDAETKAEA